MTRSAPMTERTRCMTWQTAELHTGGSLRFAGGHSTRSTFGLYIRNPGGRFGSSGYGPETPMDGLWPPEASAFRS